MHIGWWIGIFFVSTILFIVALGLDWSTGWWVAFLLIAIISGLVVAWRLWKGQAEAISVTPMVGTAKAASPETTPVSRAAALKKIRALTARL